MPALINKRRLGAIVISDRTEGRAMRRVFFLRNETGATAIEYALIASLIAVVIITGVTAVGTGLSSTFNTVSGKLN
jgi:pilus assembly protein Flp/PilA